MDLLAGYGSDASDGPEPAQQPPTKQKPTSSSLPDDFFQLAPKNQASPAKPLAFGKLPAPKAVTKFRVPLHVAPVVSDDDDEAPAPAPKRSRTDAPTSISDFLPAPKNTSTVLGGNSGAVRQPTHRHATIDIDPDEPAAGPAPPPDDDDAVPYESNELYAVPADVDPDAYYAQLAQAQEPQQPVHAEREPIPAGLPAHDAALIEAALRVTEGGGRKGLKLAQLDLVEMSQEKLTEINAVERAEMEMLHNALKDVARGGGGVSLEGGSGRGMHGGKAKSKHQISTLYATAKAREYNLLRSRGGVAYQSAQHKRETKAKYGW